MHIVLHAGAHFTEEDRLFKTILRNADDFARRGVTVPGRSRYRQLLRELMGALDDAPPSDDAREIVLDAILDGEMTDRVILSHAHIFGAPRACLREGMLYDLAPHRLRSLAQVFQHDTVELFLALRNPAAFLPDLYNHSPQDNMRAFLRGEDAMAIRWSDCLRAMREMAPTISITAWCFEDMPLIWAQIIRDMAGLEPGEKIIGGFDLLSQIMTQEGMQRFRAYLKSHPQMNEIQKRRVMAAFLDKFAIDEAIEEELEAPGWTDQLVEDLTALYEDDILECARIPGVTMITP